ncbi:hypothetical protein AFK68_20545 [Hydrocoleum sp. CS-953]|nr:hypothetical protein AFK68_20545 [Hydrocoleum sp. CS-953]
MILKIEDYSLLGEAIKPDRVIINYPLSIGNQVGINCEIFLSFFPVYNFFFFAFHIHPHKFNYGQKKPEAQILYSNPK